MTPAPEIARQTVSAANRVGRVCLTRGNVGGSRHPGNKTPETGLAGGRRSRPRTRLDAKFLETGKIQGIFPKNGSRGRNPRGFIVAKSAPCLTNSLLTETGNAARTDQRKSGVDQRSGRGISANLLRMGFYRREGQARLVKRRLSSLVRGRLRQTRRHQGRAAWSHGLDSGSASERSGRHGRAAPTSREGRLPRGRTGGARRPESGGRISGVPAALKRTVN